MKIKNVDFKIVRGDITKLNVDAIVCPANIALSMERGLARAIKVRGGEQIEAELHAKGPLHLGEALWTKAEGMKANYIIHAATSDQNLRTDEAILRQACQAALRCAQVLKVQSIAFPALGCGVAHFSAQGAAKIMAQEMLKCVRLHEGILKQIIFCLFEQETFRTFEQTVSGYIHHIQDTLGEGPYITVDVIIELKDGIILVERSNPPYGIALPGGFVDYGESLETAVRREAKEETNMELENLKQFHTYSDPSRDPRFHTVSTVFLAQGKGVPQAGDDAKALQVVPYDRLLTLGYAFDHKKVIEEYLTLREAAL